jgi:uncharacterized membrane protein
MMRHTTRETMAGFLRAATWLWLSMLVGLVLFAIIVGGFLWYLADRALADEKIALAGQFAAIAGTLASRWFPRSTVFSRRFDFARDESRLNAYRQALIVGLALAEFGALALLVSLLLAQILFPAIFGLALPLWAMTSLRPSMHAYEAFCRWHQERA